MKLDDPAYSSWFMKFLGVCWNGGGERRSPLKSTPLEVTSVVSPLAGFSDDPYPGGLGLAQNGSYHVPTCDWYNNGT